MTPNPGTAAAVARLRAYVAALPPPGPPPAWERGRFGPPEGAGATPPDGWREAPPPEPAAGDWPAADRPGPQPWNGGLTPGWPPAPAPPPELAAAVGELAQARRAAERAGAAARGASRENWELARAVAELERQVDVLAAELELLRG